MSQENNYVLKDGREIVNSDISAKMFRLKDIAPEKNKRERMSYGWNEAGMGYLFSQLFKNDTRYCPEIKSWFTYDGARWKRDIQDLLLSSKIKEFVDLLILYSTEIDDEEKKTSYMKFISKMGDRRFRERMMKDARDDLSINANEFDKDPNLINCLNGTFDLSLLKFREHRWEDFITKQTNFEYTSAFNEDSNVIDNTLEFPRWEKFIEEITSKKVNGEYVKDDDKIDYLQRALGYSMLGTSKEECMFILYGKTTRNGKSTLLNTIQHMLGDYSINAPVELICKNQFAKNPEAASPVLASLKGKRLVTMAESQDTGNLDESMIKQLTGGEEITARALRQEPITYLPQFTIWLSCNSLPQVKDKSLFNSDRLRVIEFNRHFNESNRDTELKSIFESKLAMKGVFTWLLRGYIKYKKHKLSMTKEMKKVIEEYAKDNDLVLQFLIECCKTSDANITTKDLYSKYTIWTKRNGFKPLSSKRFVKEVLPHTDWYKEFNNEVAPNEFIGLSLKEDI